MTRGRFPKSVWRIEQGGWTLRRAVALVLLSGLVAARCAALERPELETLPVEVDAASITYDRQRERIVASGDVLVRYGETEVRADEVIVYRAIPLVQARGNVQVSDPEGVLFADSVELNLEEETGRLVGAAVRSRRFQYSLWASKMEKRTGLSFHIVNGRFTTCVCESGAQSWSITAQELDVTVDGYGFARGAKFQVLDVPVLYLPRVVVPVQRERQSGFLLPRFGLSNERGLQVVLPFYWAIGPTREATFGVDVESAKRLGALAEYQYRSSRVTGGRLAASYFNEAWRASPGPGGPPKDRWSVAAEQVEHWKNRWRLYSDVLLVSDDRFFREMNTYAFDRRRTNLFRTLPYTRSRVGSAYIGDRYVVDLEGQYYQDLTERVESHTVQVAPRLRSVGQFALQRQWLVDWRAEWSHFERGRGPAGSRWLASPTVTWFAPTLPWVRSEVSIGLLGRAYALTDARPLAQQQSTLIDAAHREQVNLRAEASTSLERVYRLQRFGVERLKHTIEPVVGYYYLSAAAQADLPFFDAFDRINRRNVMSFGVGSRLLGRMESSAQGGKAEIREFGRLLFLQSYDLSRDVPRLSPQKKPSQFSDVDLVARINPSRFLSFRWWGTFDPRGTEFSSAQIALFAEDPRQPDEVEGRRLQTRTSAGVGYRLLANNVLQQVDGNVVLRLTDWAGVTYATRYNVPARRFLETYVGLRLLSRCDCWSLDVAISNRTNPAETEARLQWTLVGLNDAGPRSRVARSP